LKAPVDGAAPTAAVTSPDCDNLAAAIVVFAHETRLAKLRWLKHGFRHCFVAIAQAGDWIIYDPLSSHSILTVLRGVEAEQLVSWYRRLGLTVIATRQRVPPHRPAPVRPYTCVEAVKRVLGLHAPWVLTPWQLYRHLGRHAGTTGLTRS
jgi:hypothetical protein